MKTKLRDYILIQTTKIIMAMMLLFSIGANAQSGADCNNAIVFSNANSCIDNNSQNGTYMWFRFTADETSKIIELKKHPLSGGHIHAMGLLADDCNTITILDSAIIVPGNDSLLVINATNLIVGNSYFIVTERDKPTCTKCVTGAAEFDLCVIPNTLTLNFIGNIDTITVGTTLFLTNTSVGFSDNTSFYWNFGDVCFINTSLIGSPLQYTCNDSTLGTSQYIFHSYFDSGTFIITLSAKDYYGTLHHTSKTIYVVALPPTCPSSSNCEHVINGNFETFVSCYTAPGNVIAVSTANVLSWSSVYSSSGSAVASPDYFLTNTCVNSSTGLTNNNNFVPNNFAGCQASHLGGSAYTGLYTYSNSFSNYREYIRSQLCTPLLAGQQYRISYWISFGEISIRSTLPPAAYLSTFLPTQPTTGTNISAPSSNLINVSTYGIINDRTNWVNINEIYVANGGEQFITIGNFNNDANTSIQNETSIICSSSTITPGIIASGAYYYIDDVSVTPTNVSVTASASPTVICTGNSTTLTASGGITYTWMPGGLSGTSITVTPTVTTTYTVTALVANCYASTTVTVTVNPNPVVTVNSPTICAGNFATLTASGATTYTWMPGGLTGSSINVSPTTTTTYTVTGTTAGCSGTATATVTVNPAPTVTATASPSSFIIGGSTTLTASGTPGVNYTWSPGGSTGSTLTVTPTATGTYTYTVMAVNPVTGCASSTTVTFTVQPPQCNLVYDYVIPSGATSVSVFGGIPGSTLGLINKNIYINGNFIINHKMTLVGCNVVMAPSARITVLGDMQLEITQKTHVFSCVDMWDGIYVLFHGKLNVKGSSIIEDGISAVNIANGAYLCTFDEAIFNKNLTAINITANIGTSSPVLITRSVFTSRVIPTFTSILLNPTITPIMSNIAAGAYPFANINGYAAASIPVQRGGIGINANNVNSLTIGLDAIAPSGSITNTFDAIKCGVKLSNTNATIQNNVFQYHLNPSTLCTSCLNLAGYGVYASSTSATASYSLQVGGNVNIYQPNTFKNNFIAVYATNYRTNGIIKNSIDNISTGTPSPFGYGQTGVFLQPAQNNVVVVNENTITNCKEGIFVNLSTTTATSSIVAMQVNNNTITANSTGFCNNGIYLTALVTGTATVNAQVKDNVITEAVNGIQLLNLKRTVNVQTNSCEVRYASTGNRNGIVAKGCQQLKIENNHTKYNNVGGSAYTFPTGNINAYGIYLQQSSNMLVKCNKIDDAARSMVFEGTCTSSPWLAGYGIFQNTMSRAQDGFVLLNNGVIGQQGAFTTPPIFNYASNNYWDNTTTPTFTRSQTMTENTFNANVSSKLFMNNTVLTMPTNNQTLIGTPGTHNYLSTGTSPGLNIATALPAACGAVPAIAPPGGGGSVAFNYGNELKTLLEDSVNLQFYIQETNWMRKQFVYYELMNNAPMAAFNGLNTFKAEMLTGNVGKLKRVDERIENGNYIAANAINNTVNPENIIEQNQKAMNTYIIKKLINPFYTYTSTEAADVFVIANQCPLEGGQAVYQARNLAMDIKQEVIDFVDNCDKLPRRAMQQNETISETPTSDYKLYPNPNDGSMNLIYSLKVEETGNFVLHDITGKVIQQYKLQTGENNQLFINETQLNSGVYFYKVIIDGIVKVSDKLVIIK